MKIENQVCTLEQAKRLKELGVEAVPLYWHYCGFMTEKHGIVQYDFVLRYNSANAVYPAFTVAELGAMLPDQIPTNSNIVFAELIIRNDGEWGVGYDVDRQTDGGYGATVKSLHCVQYGKTEAQSRAAMLIYLLENNLITATDCNNRLNSDI